MIKKHPFAQGLSVAAVLLLSACGSSPTRHSSGDPIATAEDAMLDAEDARASDYAAPEMRSARDKLEQARLLQKQKGADGKDDPAAQRRARWLAEEATADAELAQAKAKNVRAHAVIQQAQDGPLPPLVEPPPMAPAPNSAMPREPVQPRSIPAPVVPGAAAVPAGQDTAAPNHGVPAPVVPGADAIAKDPDAPPPPDAAPPPNADYVGSEPKP